jgi:hypothetical protein
MVVVILSLDWLSFRIAVAVCRLLVITGHALLKRRWPANT